MAHPPLDLIEIVVAAAGVSEGQFVAEYPHPLLIPEKICSGLLEELRRKGGSGTMVVGDSVPGGSRGVESGQVLVVRKEAHKGRLDRFGQAGSLGSWISIGRQSNSEVMVNDFTVSKEHAQIRQVEDGFEIEDLESSNKTLVNGTALVPGVPVRLESGDKLRLGRVELRFFRSADLYSLFAPSVSDFDESIKRALNKD